MNIQCSQWTDCGVPNGGCCGLGKYGGKPSFGVCLKRCADYDGPPRGLGDLIAKATNAIGIRKCGGCAKRQIALNGLTRRA